MIKYIKPKTYKFIDKEKYGDRPCVGFVANDMKEYKGFPEDWGNIVREGRDGYLKFDYTMCVPVLWSALQSAFNEIDDLKKEVAKLREALPSVKKLSKDNEASPKAKAKAKSKN